MQTRQIFQTYFARGYLAVDFELDRARGTGRYLLAQSNEEPRTKKVLSS